MIKLLKYLALPAFFLIYGLFSAFSQEILTGIEINQPVRDRHLDPGPATLKSLDAGMLELPFFDDFSQSDVYPDQGKWSDKYVFVNNDYPVNPVSIGVATFDAIDHTGALYSHASTWPFVADSLTSLPINLDYLPEDSIYLSFFYQPQGKGDMPQSHDSLRLEFYSPENDEWNNVWSVPGNSLHDFRLVMIPVTAPEYLREGFRIRFSNIASLADNHINPGAMGNGDHWNIDYIYLNRDRTFSDTVFRDVAFVRPLESLLNNYESMPWNQFQQGRVAEMASVIPVTYRNNDNVTRNIRRQFSIFNVQENRPVHSFSGGTANIGASSIQEFNADLAYSFSGSGSHYQDFRIKAWIETDYFDFKGNDTVTYLQSFGDYFALDDGTAEKGYGLSGGGTENARLAYKFNAYTPDSLQAVNIYFNQSLNNASRQYFHLAIWDDNNGKPGNRIYSLEGVRPMYGETLNSFHTYHLDHAVPVSGVFYVGIIQTSTDFLNIGWDVNRDNSHRIFYNIHGDWKNTSFEGSLMIRPVMGSSPVTSVTDNLLDKPSVRVYPNPAARVLYIDAGPGLDRNMVRYKLYNRVGQMVYQGTGHDRSIDLSSFLPGIYFLRVESGSAVLETKKIMITK